MVGVAAFAVTVVLMASGAEASTNLIVNGNFNTVGPNWPNGLSSSGAHVRDVARNPVSRMLKYRKCNTLLNPVIRC
jgi:hypothetical protein